MREAIAALEAALGQLDQARAELPDDLRAELAGIIDQARAILDSIRAKSTTSEPDGIST